MNVKLLQITGACLLTTGIAIASAQAITLTPDQRQLAGAALAEVREAALLQGELELGAYFIPEKDRGPGSPAARAQEGVARSRVSLIALADAVGDATPVESDGTLETELILIGRALRSPDSETSKLFAKFQDPIEDHLPPNFMGGFTWHRLDQQHATELCAAYQPPLCALHAMSAEQLHATRIAWVAVLLMPGVVGLPRMDAEVGVQMAQRTLESIGDPDSVPVLIERIRLDLIAGDARIDRVAYEKPTPEGLLWTAMELCTVDSEVSHLDVGLILEGVAIIEEHSPNGQWNEMYSSPLLTKFAAGYFRSPDRLQAQPAPPEGAATSSEVQRMLDLTAWKSAMAAYPRENLTPAQTVFLDRCEAIELPLAD